MTHMRIHFSRDSLTFCLLHAALCVDAVVRRLRGVGRGARKVGLLLLLHRQSPSSGPSEESDKVSVDEVETKRKEEKTVKNRGFKSGTSGKEERERSMIQRRRKLAAVGRDRACEGEEERVGVGVGGNFANPLSVAWLPQSD